MYLTVNHRSSTCLHLLFYCNIVYTIFWLILEILCFLFKYYHLIYPSYGFGIEFSLIFIVASNDFVRQYFGIRGNLLMDSGPMIVSIVYGLICAAGFAFFLILQTYIQRVEILLAGIALLLIIFEILLTIVTFIRDRRGITFLTDQQKVQRYNEAQRQFRRSMKLQ